MFDSLVPADITKWLFYIVVFCVLWLTLRRRRFYRLPPGPLAIPFVGNITMLGGDVLEKFAKLREIHGDIFRLRFGPKLLIVFNGYETLKEVFVKNGDVFSDRPHTFAMDRIGKGMGLVGTSGESWKEQRKFALTTLRDFGMGRNILQIKIQKEIQHLLECFDSYEGQDFAIRPILQIAVSNIICLIVFGKRFEYDDHEFQQHLRRVDENLQVIGNVSLINLFPLVRYLPGDPAKFQRTIENAECVKAFFKQSVREHHKRLKEDQINDFIDAYLCEIERTAGTGTGFHEEQLLKVIADLFVAGSETTATTLSWAALYFLHYPDVQDKVREEIHQHIDRKRLPCMEDRPNLPYCEATIMEIQRFSDITPTALPHAVPHDVQFRGFDIPKGAILLPNIHSVLHDKNLWDQPDRFLPTRFLDNEGNVQKPDHFIPFHFGRRVCLGESLAKMELFLLITAILQKFRFELPSGGHLPSTKGVLGLTRAPVPFKIKLSKI